MATGIIVSPAIRPDTSSNKRKCDSTSNSDKLITVQPLRPHTGPTGPQVDQDLSFVSAATTGRQHTQHQPHSVQSLRTDWSSSDNFGPQADNFGPQTDNFGPRTANFGPRNWPPKGAPDEGHWRDDGHWCDDQHRCGDQHQRDDASSLRDDGASNETCTIVSNWDDDDQSVDELDVDGGPHDEPGAASCGWLSFRPAFLVRFATIQVFVFFSCVLVTLQQALSSGYFNSVMTTIEKRFDIPSRVSGAIISTFEMGNLVTILFVSYFGTHRHIPVWMGKGIVVTGIGSLLFALPHFINTNSNTNTNNNQQQRLDGEYISTISTNNNNNHANVCKIQVLKSESWIEKIQNGADTGRLVDTNASHSQLSGLTRPIGATSDKYPLAQQHPVKTPASACNINNNVFVETHILIFMIAMILIGCGGTPVFTLGTTFIDDHVPKESSSMYIGFMYSMVAFGLVIGFLLGGYLIGTVNENIYGDSLSYLTSVDAQYQQQQIHPGHPRWIGAWWLGFIILGVLLILVSLPFFAFPKSLKVRQKRKGNATTAKRRLKLYANHNKSSMIVINCDKGSGQQTRENIRTMSLGNQSFNELIIKRNHSMGAISSPQTNNRNNRHNRNNRDIRNNSDDRNAAIRFDSGDSNNKLLLCYCDRKQAAAIDQGPTDKQKIASDKQQKIIVFHDKHTVIENTAAMPCDDDVIIEVRKNNRQQQQQQIDNGCNYKIGPDQLLFDLDDINNNTARCPLTECRQSCRANNDHDDTQTDQSVTYSQPRPNWVSLVNLFSGANGQSRSPVSHMANKGHIRQRSHDYKLLLNDDCGHGQLLNDDCGHGQLLNDHCGHGQLRAADERLSSKLIYLCQRDKHDAATTTLSDDNNNQLSHCCRHHHCCCCKLHNNKQRDETTTTFIQPLEAPGELDGSADAAHDRNGSLTAQSAHHSTNYGKDLKDIPRCMWNLLINPIYIVTCLGSSLELAIVSGFLIFLPKYLETQFGLSKSQSSLYSGGIAVPGACFGILFGGYILKQYQMKPKSAIQFVLFINLLCIGFYTIFYFLGCPNPLMAGATINYPDSAARSYSLLSRPGELEKSYVNLTSQCNAPCQCSPNDIEPVCGQDGLTYFSPCHAGCFAMQSHSRQSYTNNYSQCACVSATVPKMGPHAANQSGPAARRARSGPCPNQCQAIIPFMILLFFMTLVVSITQMPLLMITLRSVRDEERSFALGMQFVIFRLLAYIPAPILFGNVIDGTCLLWRANCGPQSGFCLIYDIEHFRLRYVGLFSALKVAAGLLFFLDWYLICWKSDTNQLSADQRSADSTGNRMLPMGTIASSLVSLDRMSAFALSATMRDEHQQIAILDKQQSHPANFLHRQPAMRKRPH